MHSFLLLSELFSWGLLGMSTIPGYCEFKYLKQPTISQVWATNMHISYIHIHVIIPPQTGKTSALFICQGVPYHYPFLLLKYIAMDKEIHIFGWWIRLNYPITLARKFSTSIRTSCRLSHLKSVPKDVAVVTLVSRLRFHLSQVINLSHWAPNHRRIQKVYSINFSHSSTSVRLCKTQ